MFPSASLALTSRPPSCKSVRPVQINSRHIGGGIIPVSKNVISKCNRDLSISSFTLPLALAFKRRLQTSTIRSVKKGSSNLKLTGSCVIILGHSLQGGGEHRVKLYKRGESPRLFLTCGFACLSSKNLIRFKQ